MYPKIPAGSRRRYKQVCTDDWIAVCQGWAAVKLCGADSSTFSPIKFWMFYIKSTIYDDKIWTGLTVHQSFDMLFSSIFVYFGRSLNNNSLMKSVKYVVGKFPRVVGTRSNSGKYQLQRIAITSWSTRREAWLRVLVEFSFLIFC
jgi:hypothetical protein